MRDVAHEGQDDLEICAIHLVQILDPIGHQPQNLQTTKNDLMISHT
jgi:hypothetical protein